MGTYVENKIGFYFELQESAKTFKRTKTISSCSNENCPESKKEIVWSPPKFCKECGSEITAYEKSLGNEFPSAYWFCENYLDGDEVVATDNGGLPDNVWLYNYLRPEKLSDLVPESGEQKVVDLTNINVKEWIEEFKEIKEVDHFLQTFEDVFGEDSVIIKFGLYTTHY